ncbi:MAG: hypothetical protein HS115_10455 [Spirochaetales bacterium]|nr:hypothetical protein [Spirochaetales bacterium]
MALPSALTPEETRARVGEAVVQISRGEFQTASMILSDLLVRIQKDQEYLAETQVTKDDFRLLIEEMRAGFQAVDRRFEAVDKRFEAVDKRFDDLIHQMDKRFEAVDKRFEAMDRRFQFLQWLFGFFFAFISVILTYGTFFK